MVLVDQWKKLHHSNLVSAVISKCFLFTLYEELDCLLKKLVVFSLFELVFSFVVLLAFIIT